MVPDALRLTRVRAVVGSDVRRGLRDSSWGFGDQALISASNFVMMVLLARQLGPQSFGTFVVAYTVLLFANSMQSALFTQPHNVLGAPRMAEDYAQFTSATFLTQILFCTVVALLIAIAGGVALNLGHGFSSLLFAMAFATFTWQVQEFCRRVYYTQEEYKRAFTIDLVTYGGLVLLLAILWREGSLTATTAVLAVAVASLAGAVNGIYMLWTVLTTLPDANRFKGYVVENWMFGKWLAGSQAAMWTSGHLYPVLTAGFVGAAATGAFRATQNFVAPTHILINTMESVFVPKAAREYRHNGLFALKALVARLALPIGGAVLLYLLLIILLHKWLVTIVFGDSYSEYAWLVNIHAANYMLLLFSGAASMILRSKSETAPVFVAYLVSSVMVLTVGVWLVMRFGLVGASIGMILHQITLNLMLWPRALRSAPTGTGGDYENRAHNGR